VKEWNQADQHSETDTSDDEESKLVINDDNSQGFDASNLELNVGWVTTVGNPGP
jgi:hypothetical protein